MAPGDRVPQGIGVCRREGRIGRMAEDRWAIGQQETTRVRVVVEDGSIGDRLCAE